MFLHALECSWCILEKNELIGEVLVALELIDLDLVHLDLSYGGIKLES